MFVTLTYYLVISSFVFAQIDYEKPPFRIIAPQIVCSSDENADENDPDTTLIIVQARAGVRMNVTWTVRWAPLLGASQRFTLLLWRSVRSLEKSLNQEQAEPFYYVIDNREFVPDVDYSFKATAKVSGAVVGHKTFTINKVSGKRNLELIDVQVEKVSLVLLGSQFTYSDLVYVLQALITTCHHTQDYHFSWSVYDTETGNDMNITDISSRLVIPVGTLAAGRKYEISCEVIRSSDELFLNQMRMTVQVYRRELKASLNYERLVISTEKPFVIKVTIFDYDGLTNDIKFEWWCTFEDLPCDFFKSIDKDHYYFSLGLPRLGIYEIEVLITAVNESTTARVMVAAINPKLPILEVAPIPRLLNEGTQVKLVGNASQISPHCTLAWYFAPVGHNETNNGSCDNCQHGVQMMDSVTVYSLDENFLDELTDFSNQSEWRQVGAEMPAAAGRLRFVAECGCSLTYSCEAAGTAYAEYNLELNYRPLLGDLTVYPAVGVAMKTMFTIRTQTAHDLEPPLRYTFFVVVGTNLTLLLDSYLEYNTVETMLPYTNGVTQVWVNVCDSLGACSDSETVSVNVSAGDGASASLLAETAQGLLRRCDFLQLRRLSVCGVVTFQNSAQLNELSAFTSDLTEMLAMGPGDICLQEHTTEYTAFIAALSNVGIDLSIS